MSVQANFPDNIASYIVGYPAGSISGVANWMLSGATIDMDFANGRYAGGTLSALISNANATGGYVTNSDGSLTLIGANIPRIGRGTGLLVEEARTNIALRSNDFNQAVWGINANGVATATTASGNSPDGTADAWTLAATNANSAHNLQQGPFTVSNGATVTVSYYFKFNTQQWEAPAIFDVTAGAWLLAVADVQNCVQGLVDAGVTGTVTNAGNGWCRASITRTLSGTQFYAGLFMLPSNTLTQTWAATTANKTDAFGGQAEVGAFPTSYIPTTTVAVTRAADNVQTAGALLNLLKGAAGSYVLATGALGHTAVSGARLIDGGTYGTIINADNQLQVQNSVAALTPTAGSGLFSTGAMKSGVAWDGSGISAVLSNGTVATNAGLITGQTAFALGSFTGTAAFVDGYNTRLTGWISRLADIPFKALTA